MSVPATPAGPGVPTPVSATDSWAIPGVDEGPVHLGAPLIRLHQARVRHGTVVALDGIDLTVHRGERLVLVGPNGSGKSTLLRVLHGVQTAERHATPEPAREVLPLDPEGRMPRSAMVFQRPFFLRLSVRRNLALALWLAGAPKAERPDRIDRALHQVGLTDLADRSALTLSGGQQQRLALARAWALQPDILFLDEPTASLDPAARQEIETLIHEAARDGMTIVMSTHHLDQARRLGSRIACLEAGRLQAVGPTKEFFRGPDPSARDHQSLDGETRWRG